MPDQPPPGRYGPATAICKRCSRSIRLRKDGTFRDHQAWLSGRQFPPACEGVGQRPSDQKAVSDV